MLSSADASRTASLTDRLGTALGDQLFRETAILKDRGDPPQQTPRSSRRLPGAAKAQGTLVLEREDEPVAILEIQPAPYLGR